MYYSLQLICDLNNKPDIWSMYECGDWMQTSHYLRQLEISPQET